MTATWTAPPETVDPPRAAMDGRRALQLGLAAVWLLDGVLQYQSWMFTKAFGQLLAGAASGNPAVIARPIIWDAHLVEHYPVLLNAVFATIQLLLGLGIAWRPTVRVALGASIAWSLAVWWLGEGLGGVLATPDSAVAGGPGAVILYALLAVLLWPGSRPASFVAAGATGPAVARALWFVLWGSLACLSLTPATRAPRAVSGMISDMASGEPRWLGRTDQHLAAFLATRGGAAAVILAVVLAVVAAGIYLPPRARRAVLVLAIVTAAVLWMAQGLGGMLTGGGTDPNSGPLLALLALAFWPLAARPELAKPELAQPELAPSELVEERH